MTLLRVLWTECGHQDLPSPSFTQGKPCSAQLSPEATIPGISTIPCFASKTEPGKLGLGSHEILCSESLPVSINCFFFGRKQNRSWFPSYLETTCFLTHVVLLTVPATPNMSCFLPAINSNPKDALLGRDEIHTTPDLLLQCNHESFFRALFQHYTYSLFF